MNEQSQASSQAVQSQAGSAAPQLGRDQSPQPVRPSIHQQSVAQGLARELVLRQESINRELGRNGVRFGIYKGGEYHDRLFPYDPIPRIIESDDFDQLEAGLKQRVNALNAYLRDVYSDKRAVHDGVVPEEYVYTCSGYFPQVNGVTPPGGVFAHIAGEDLVQGEDGRWWVLEDNLRIPSGASYPLFVRDIERRLCPKLFRDVRVRDNRDYSRLLRKAVDFVSTDGLVVVLTPGRYNSAFFEHAYLAEKMGATLAFPEDLQVVDSQVYFLDYAGRQHRVGAIYRRLSDEYLDPFAFNPDSVIGVPGLLSAYRAGNVAIVNAPGNGAADDKAIYYFVPDMIRYYLGEEPILHNAPTYMPLFEADRQIILDRLGELVIKDVAEAGGYGVVFGSSLDRAARQDLAERIVAEPRRFIAQEVIQFRDIDVVDPDTGELSPRKCDLRAFVVTGKNTHVWYSGLTRYSSVPGQMIVNSSQGGGFKDTWILAPQAGSGWKDESRADDGGWGGGSQDAVIGLSATAGLDSPAESAVAGPTDHSQSEPAWPTDSETGSGPAAVLLAQPQRHSLSLVTDSKVGNLFWLGRYTERVFTTLDRFFPFYDRVMDTDVDAFRPFARALDLPEDFQDFDAFIESFLYDARNPDSVRNALQSAFHNAVVLRAELGSRLLQYIELALSNLDNASAHAGDAEVLYKQRDIEDDMLAFWGGVENSPVDPILKSFIFIGKYIERLDLYTRFGLPSAEMSAPLAKLTTYALPLEGLPIPQYLSEGLRWLVNQLPGRGYADLADRLRGRLDDFSQRMSFPSIKDSSMLNAMNMDVNRP